MNDSLLISELLKESFATECETVGPTNLQDIVESEVGFTSAEHGSYMDLGESIAILISATTFIKTALEIYTLTKKELGREPEKDELEIKIIAKKELVQGLDKKARDRLIKAIIKKLKERE
jgi:hypothetical protein